MSLDRGSKGASGVMGGEPDGKDEPDDCSNDYSSGYLSDCLK